MLSLLFWMSIARVVRGQVLAIREKEFVEAAQASGASPMADHRAPHHPNMIGPIMVNTTLARRRPRSSPSRRCRSSGSVVQPPQTSWGKMLSDAEGYVGTSKAYLLYGPGLAILITVLVRELHR